MKKTLLLLCALCLAIASQATVVNSSQARAKAQAFLNEKGLSGTLSEVPNQKARIRNGENTDLSYYYIYNVGTNGGYVIVSGDDATPAVLGYATRGSVDLSRMPANMSAWLQGYADQIRYLQEHPVTPVKGRARVAKASHPAVADLIKTTWDQGDPYNLLIEKLGESHCVTGCATTAMAQIMYYHQYPKKSPAIAGYTTETEKIKCLTLPATTFEWDKMSTSYGAASSEESRMAVAKLMQYVATALKADLGTGMTSVWDVREAPALSTFGYGKGVELKIRELYTDDQWDNIIYHEISNARPVLYCGQADDGGHAFVVHGYDGNGYYSVNWGWSGAGDGKYLLSAMTPNASGIGSTDTSGNGYNTGQTALVGISPNNVETYVVTDDVIALTTDDLALLDDPAIYQPNTEGCYSVNLRLLFVSRLANTYNFDFDFKILKDGELHGYLFGEEAFIEGLPPLYGFPYDDTQPEGHETDLTLDFPCGADGIFNEAGTYKIIPVSRKTGEKEWLENFGSDTYYLTGIIAEDSTLTLYVGEVPSPELIQAREKLKAATDKLQETLTQLLAYYQEINSTLNAQNEDLKAITEQIEDLTAKASETEELLKQYSGGRTRTATPEEVEAFRKRLEAIQTDIAKLKTMRDKLEQQITKVGQDIQTIGETLTQAEDLQEQALTALKNSKEPDELNKLTKQVNNTQTSLAFTGVQNINITIDNLNVIIDNTNIVNDNVSKVAKKTDELLAAVRNAFPDGIDSLSADESEIQGRYDLQGRPVGKNHKGITIVRFKNGQTRKLNL